ncbi:MAG TPA: ABC transporter permease [Spirochaetota bacterium]|nr:ABC transporter permease [Spirochaetota bacterium]HNT11049.1 ABC transporter permease [Spirochaetota bacterium]HPU88558.1 ABC transporter permease [Spirochaetota bacterium]
MSIKFIHSFFGLFGYVGQRIVDTIELTGYTLVLLLQAGFYTKNVFSKRREILKQMYIAAVKTFFVVSVVALFTGMIVALQTGIEMKAFKQEALIGNVIIATMTREMGPFMTAIILTASVGSAMAAEIGTMTVSEEVDALQMMSISPVKFLVMPRVVAMAIMVPIMTVYTNALGTLGGGVVANYQLQVSWEVYYSHVLESLHFKAVYTGLLKSFIFGLIISGVSCAQGLRATNGALGVGKATREAVVISFLMVLIIGYFITAVFYGKE